MKINFVGNFQNGYVGELGDAVHLARELEDLGNTVRRIPQDEWREWVIEYPRGEYPNVPKDLKADINIICKWHHFYDGSFIEALRKESGAPVFYWVWDYMNDGGLPDWHIEAVKTCDLYLGNDVRDPIYRGFEKQNMYYFPFDVADAEIYKGIQEREKIYDVSFFGSWIGQGDRKGWLEEINKYIPLKVFSWNHYDWPVEFDASPAVYGHDFVRAVKRSKIVLGFSVEPHSWGYWSNRVGKTLLAGGFLLYQYAPGMELFLRDGAEYFSNIEEALAKIDYYLLADTERDYIANTGWMIAQDRFSSRERIKDLMILIDRYLQEGGKGWKV